MDPAEPAGKLASFLAGTSTTNIVFSATAMSPMTLSTLVNQLPANESILSGVGLFDNQLRSKFEQSRLPLVPGRAGKPANELDVWHYDGSTWTEYSPTDLTYDGNYASFTATGFSGYAMVGVPEPGTITLLAAGLFGPVGLRPAEAKGGGAIAGGRDSSAIGVPAQEGFPGNARTLPRLRRPDRQAITSTRGSGDRASEWMGLTNNAGGRRLVLDWSNRGDLCNPSVPMRPRPIYPR